MPISTSELRDLVKECFFCKTKILSIPLTLVAGYGKPSHDSVDTAVLIGLIRFPLFQDSRKKQDRKRMSML